MEKNIVCPTCEREFQNSKNGFCPYCGATIDNTDGKIKKQMIREHEEHVERAKYLRDALKEYILYTVLGYLFTIISIATCVGGIYVIATAASNSKNITRLIIIFVGVLLVFLALAIILEVKMIKLHRCMADVNGTLCDAYNHKIRGLWLSFFEVITPDDSIVDSIVKMEEMDSAIKQQEYLYYGIMQEYFDEKEEDSKTRKLGETLLNIRIITLILMVITVLASIFVAFVPQDKILLVLGFIVGFVILWQGIFTIAEIIFFQRSRKELSKGIQE